jgi:hypothetical protein
VKAQKGLEILVRSRFVPEYLSSVHADFLRQVLKLLQIYCSLFLLNKNQASEQTLLQ